jgi:hypothetical protein
VNKIRLVDVIDLAKDFQVSTDAIFWRLVNLKVLKRETLETRNKRIKLVPSCPEGCVPQPSISP